MFRADDRDFAFRHCATAAVLGLAMNPAQAITLDDLKGVSIQTRNVHDTRIRRAEGDFNSQATSVMKFKIDADGRINGEVSRTVTTPFGPRTRTTPMNARIGQPGEPPTGGHGLWVIDGDKLVLLRALEQGGFKVEIEFKGTGKTMTCVVRAPFVREEGSGEIRSQQSVVGGPVTILSATEKSSDCKVVR